MWLKMNTGLGGPEFNLVRGDKRDFTDPHEARRLVDAGFADPADDEARAELAALAEAEAAEADAAAKAQADAAAAAEADAAAKAEADAAAPAAKAKKKG